MPENEAVTFPAREEVALRDQPMPEPGGGEVLIETTRTLISTGTECAALTGQVQWGEFPFESIGYSNVGEVVAVGDGVDDGWIGRRVASTTRHARYVVADVEDCRPIPDGVSDEAAAFFRIAEITMNGVRRGKVEWGETVAVFGLGLIGQFATRWCRDAGAERVLAHDIAPERLEYLPDRTGVIGVNPESEDPVERLRAETGGRLADVVIEATGHAGAIPDQFDLLRDLGRFVVLSSPRDTGEFDYYRDCHRPGYEIIGAHMRTHPEVSTLRNQWVDGRHGELFFSLLGDGRVAVEPLISHRAPAADADEMYEMLVNRRTEALGVVLEWD